MEYFNEEPGALWMQRVTDIYESVVWLNPVQRDSWEYVPSTQLMREIIGERMFPLTLSGIESAMAELKR